MEDLKVQIERDTIDHDTTCPNHRKVTYTGVDVDQAALTGESVPVTTCPNHRKVTSAGVDVDQAARTGESLPVTLHKDDKTLMGSTVVRGEIESIVEIMIVRNLTILPLFMYLIALCYTYQIVLFMKALSLVVALLRSPLP